MKKLDLFIIEYLNFNKKVLLRSENTLKAYRNDLNSFRFYLFDTFQIDNIDEIELNHLRDWQVHLMNNTYVTNSIRRKISCINQFFDFLSKRDIIDENIASKLVIPKKIRKLPQILEGEKIVEVINQLESTQSFPLQRDYIILLLLYSCGLRKEELLHLTHKSINLENNQLLIVGKGNKERIIPIPTFVINKILSYINIRNREFDRYDFDTILVSNRGKKLYAKLIYNVVKKYFGNIAQGKIYPHILRHSFASHLLENGAKIEYVRQLLGHSSLAATQIYTHLSIDQLQKAYKINHPRS